MCMKSRRRDGMLLESSATVLILFFEMLTL